MNGGFVTLEVVNGVTQQVCGENIEPSSGEFFVQVDPRVHYLTRLRVNPGQDPNRIFIAYTSINGTFVGCRQILSQRPGFRDTSMSSTIVGINQPIRFQQATLVGSENNFHSNILHMGKVTVKIYEGIFDRRQTAFGNNADPALSCQVGNFLECMTIHCCSTPEMGLPFLNGPDQERLKRALMKRTNATDENSYNPNAFKRVKTETGYVNAATTANAASDHNGMDCDNMVLQPHTFPLA